MKSHNFFKGSRKSGKSSSRKSRMLSVQSHKVSRNSSNIKSPSMFVEHKADKVKRDLI